MKKYEVMFDKMGSTQTDVVDADSHYHARALVILKHGRDIKIKYILEVYLKEKNV